MSAICSRVIINNKRFKTENWKETEWKQSSDINVHGVKAGTVEVCYLEERLLSAEGPFLREERQLIDTIAGQLGKAHECMQDRAMLRESEKFDINLLRNSPNPIVVINSDTSVRYVNQAFEDLTGFTAAEIIGRKAPYPWWTDTPEQAFRCLREGMYYGERRLDVEFKRKDGERFWVELNSTPIKQDGKLRHFLSSWVDITERKRLKNSMQFYISGSIKAQEEERKRVSRELHDDTIQSLATLSQNIETTISKEKDRLPEETLQQLEAILYKARSIMQGVRRFSHELRPDIIDRLGLVPSLEQLTSELNKENGIKARIEVIGSEKRLPPEIELVLFRIAQEALRNIWKHSQSTEAVIKLEFTLEEAEMNVSDDGRGFRVAKYLSDFAGKGKLGLCGMQERARLIGGDFSVKSQLGRGTTIKVKVKV